MTRAVGAKITDEAKAEAGTLHREQQCRGSSVEGLMGLQQRRGGMLTQCSAAATQWLQEDSTKQQPMELQ